MRVWILVLIVSTVILLGNFFGSADLEAKLATFNELRSEHFVIHYQEEVSKDYVYEIKKVGERFYRIITQEFNLIRDQLWLWENRAKVFIAKDKQEYLSRFRCSDWSGACVNYVAKIIYTYPDQERFDSIFIHELTHIILHEYVGKTTLPSWLDEGVAAYIEDKHGGQLYQDRIAYLKRVIKSNKHIPVSELVAVTTNSLQEKPADYASLFYLESFSIINFFIERYGKHNFSRFLSYLKHGEVVNRAVAKSFRDCKNFTELEKQWIKFYLK